ncbi:M24 family metallopeptidase [Selenomonas massiliensis]|uniref:M24 family metallopeptidase n=1 Tax=Selenomonas massiliensis TaxID=2058293 RepID=UPI000D10BFC9|nr:Xaa-Pro peptidase family protein [Selenomonas massiliensis]
MNVKGRIERLRALLTEKVVDAVLVTKEENVHYFSGFRGDSTALLVTHERLLLVTDSRYTEQASTEASLYEIVEQRDGLYRKVAELAVEAGVVALGYEGAALVCDQYEKLKEMLGEISFDTSLALDALRQVKDADEIALIRRACTIADEGFAHIIRYIQPGMTELEVAAELEHYMRTLGSERPAFQTIIASGVRGSLPHGVASDKVIARGELVTMDFGAVCAGYHSDITRTICVGRADARQREIYDAVLSAQMRALAALRPGVTGIEVDRIARDSLAEKNFEQYFGHGLGHSLGLEIHEEPRLSKAGKHIMQPNMLITDEPGVYIPGWGGIRIEDTVLITADGSEPLTCAPKEFIEICT